VQTGSALDEQFLRLLGPFDIVYSWGVLHHTGNMWKSFNLITIPARNELVLCVYSDQGIISRVWRFLKRCYVKHPVSRPAIIFTSLLTLWLPKVLLLPHRVIADWKNWKSKRGMSAWHDVIDWAGGYPFEFAKTSDVVTFFQQHGFELTISRPFGRIIKMHEYVFRAKE
jgi:hypothetical protein